MNAYLKFGAAALLFLLWTALVCTNHADPGLIDAIKFALGSLGIYHAVSNLGSATPPAPTAPAPSAEQIVAQVAAVVAQHQPPQAAITFPPAPKEPA